MFQYNLGGIGDKTYNEDLGENSEGPDIRDWPSLVDSRQPCELIRTATDREARLTQFARYEVCDTPASRAVTPIRCSDHSIPRVLMIFLPSTNSSSQATR